VAARGRAKSESDVSVGSHHFLLNYQECAIVPYLARQQSCFVNWTSKYMRLLYCSRKMMIASNRHKDLYWFRPKPYV
jgi:hypothetical protein